MRSCRISKIVWYLGMIGLMWICGVACGPVQTTARVLDARAAIEAARSVKGWHWACYEYYAAKHYLQKALVEAGYSDFEAAIDFATKAVRYAQEARNLAQIRGTQNAKPPVTCNEPKDMVAKYRHLFEKSAAKK